MHKAACRKSIWTGVITVLMVQILVSCAAQRPSMPQASNPPKTLMAYGRSVSSPKQCVPYAREISGIQIFGDAHTWWSQAHAPDRRGSVPRPGAVLVLARTEKLTHGHVAVVKSILGPRQIDVTHSNWGNDKGSRSIIYDSMRVEDISPKNDWTQVRFWNAAQNCFGFPYSAYGFIYK